MTVSSCAASFGTEAKLLNHDIVINIVACPARCKPAAQKGDRHLSSEILFFDTQVFFVGICWFLSPRLTGFMHRAQKRYA